MSEASDYSALIYDPGYSIHGVVCEVKFKDGSTIADGVTVLDKTSGEEVADRGDLTRQILVPAARVRVIELTDKGVDVESMVDAVLTFNGGSWIVLSYQYMPSKFGRAGGEVQLLLEEHGDET